MKVRECKEEIIIKDSINGNSITGCNYTRYDRHGNVIYHGDDIGNETQFDITYYENPTKSDVIKEKITKVILLGKKVEETISKYDINGVLSKEEKVVMDNSTTPPTVRQVHIMEYGPIEDGNRLIKHTIHDNKKDEVFTITAQPMSEDRVIRYVDKNGLVVRAELYDMNNRVVKIEDYPGDRLYVYGYYENTKKILSSGVFSLIENTIVSKEDNTYNENGDITFSESFLGEKGQQIQTWISYDDDGKIIKQIELTTDLTTQKTSCVKVVSEYRYDESGLVSSIESEHVAKSYSYQYYK